LGGYPAIEIKKKFGTKNILVIDNMANGSGQAINYLTKLKGRQTNG
jgi:hypothetical protein